MTPSRVRPGGTAQILAIGTKATGSPIWDSTRITFRVDAGRVEPATASFDDGKAAAAFYAPPRVGTVALGAVSGTVQIEDVTIEVGWGELSSLVLSASRTNLPPQGGRLSLRVLAGDQDGNPLPSVAVVFSATAGVLASKGRPVRTNAAGLARDSLETTLDARVAAIAGSAASNSVDIDVEDVPANKPPSADFVFSPESPTVGDRVFFNGELSTDEDGFIRRWRWDFGDGMIAAGRRVTHVYRSAATWKAVLCVTDNRGATSCAEQSITVSEEQARRNLP